MKKWICQECGAVHHYQAKGCQRCGFAVLKLERDMGKKITEEPEELRLEIDELNLDREWIAHPVQYHIWAKKAAEAQLKVDQAKSNLEVLRAELGQEIRADPASYDLKKATEASVQECVVASEINVNAAKAYAEARHELEVARAAVNALEHRKRALTWLSELWVRDYYSTPKGAESPQP